MKRSCRRPRFLPGPWCTPLATALAATLFASPNRACADPQGTVGITTGISGQGEDTWWSDTRFHLGSHADLLFGRTSNRSAGAGPYVEALTDWHQLSTGIGASLLLPIHEDFPAVTSAGPCANYAPGRGWTPAASLQLFLGTRSYNYHGAYSMAFGLRISARAALQEPQDRTVIIAAQIDTMALVLPAILLYEFVRGSP